MKEDVILTVKAEKGMDIQNLAIKAYDLLESKNIDNGISRVRIKGEDGNGNDTTLDTGIMARKESIVASLDDETGEFNSQELIQHIVNIANAF